MSGTGQQQDSLLVVGVGVSGGARDLERLLRRVPAGVPVAFLVGGAIEDGAAESLEKACNLHVRPGAPGTAVEPGVVYLVPPAVGVAATGGGGIHLAPLPHDAAPEIPTDGLFRSLAESLGPCCAAVLLSSPGADGATGLRRVKAAGGLAIAAEADGMVHEAVVDLLLDPEEVWPALERFHAAPVIPLGDPADEECADRSVSDALLHELAAVFEARAGLELKHYKPATVGRRLLRRAGLCGFGDVQEYLTHLRGDRAEQGQLEHDLLIGVTEFFRDPEAFAALEEQTVRALAREAEPGGTLRAWVPACSTGEEAYSIAMLLLDAVDAFPQKDLQVQVFATDVHEGALSIARRGLYPTSIVEHVSEERLRRFFTVEDHRGFRIRPRLRDAVSFAVHDLCADPPFARMGLVSCRNLLIYLQPQAQRHALRLLHFALAPSGYLFLGSSESVGPLRDAFGTVSKAHRIYTKTGVSAHVPTRAAAIPRYRVLLGSAPVAGAAPRAPERRRDDPAELARDELLDRLPPSVVVSGEGHLLYSQGDLSPYLRLPPGRPELDFLTMVCKELTTRVRAAIYKARRSQETVEALLALEASESQVRVVATPAGRLGAGAVVVSFEPTEGAVVVRDPGSESAEQQALIEQLERELKAARDDLHTTVEELEASNEELRASNEESMSMNEELQAANEELEATTEELRSLNEELTTVNAELKEKVELLEQAHDDLSNFFASAQIATLFLDAGLRIRRFTPAARDLLDLGDTDEGRRITDIARELLQNDLAADARAVLDRFQPITRELHVRGRWLVRRVLPYRTQSGRVQGVVVAFVDVTEVRAAHERVAVRERQQTIIARLGLRALEGDDLHAFLEQVVHDVRGTLGTDTCEILSLQPDGRRLLLAAGIGWMPGVIGQATVGSGTDSQAGYTLTVGEPVVVEQLGEDPRFTPPPLLVEHGMTSGITCVVGDNAAPWGVIGAHTRERRAFTAEDASFLQAVANVLASAMGRRLTRQRLAMERSTAQVLSTAKSLAEAGPRILDVLAGELGLTICEIWLPTADGRALECAFMRAPGEPFRQEELERTFGASIHTKGEGLMGRVWERGRAEWLTSLEDPQVFRRAAAAEALSLRSAIAFPIRSGPAVTGVITLLSRNHLLSEPVFLQSLESLGATIGDCLRRLEIEATVRQSEARMSAILRGSLDAVVTMDHQGRILEFNPAAERLFGYRREEALGQELAHLIIPPPLRERHRAGLARYLESGQGAVVNRVVELTATRRDGSEVPVEVGVIRLEGTQPAVFTGIIRDISDRRRAEAEILGARRWFERVSDTTPDTVAIYDIVDDRNVYVNRSVSETLGYTPEELRDMGTGVADALVHPEDLGGFRSFFRAYRDELGDTVREHTYRIHHKEGQYRWRDLRCVPFERDADGRVRQVLIVSRDVTEQKRSEAELLRASKQKDQFMAMLGHELRNPLAAIRSAAELLKLSRIEHPDLARTQGVLDRQSLHMAKLIDGLLDVSRIVRGKIHLETEPVDLVEVVREVLTDREQQVSSRPLELRSAIAARTLLVRGDRVRLAQVVDNVLTNAVKFTEPPGTIDVELRREGATAVLGIRDSGCGIDPELLPFVFEPFRQADQQIDRSGGGLGLGLALVKGIVELHDGTVTVTSDGAGRGTEIRVVLPLDLHARAPLSEGPVRAPSRRILLVEDNEDSADLLRAVLERQGHEAAVASTGEQALELAGELRPDVVLCDIGLPGGMSGFDVARALRRDRRLDGAYLVALTGYGLPEDKQKAEEAGFDVHITKPVDAETLERVLSRASRDD